MVQCEGIVSLAMPCYFRNMISLLISQLYFDLVLFNQNIFMPSHNKVVEGI